MSFLKATIKCLFFLGCSQDKPIEHKFRKPSLIENQTFKLGFDGQVTPVTDQDIQVWRSMLDTIDDEENYTVNPKI